MATLTLYASLPDEYNVLDQILKREKEKLTIERLHTELRARYDLLKGETSLKSSDTVFLAFGTKRGIRRRRLKKCGNVSRNKKKDGRAIRGESIGKGAGGSNGAPFGKQGGLTRCNICKETGHKWFKFPNRISSVCRETDHDPNSCPQVVKKHANLAMSDEDRLSPGDELEGMCEYLQPE